MREITVMKELSHPNLNRLVEVIGEVSCLTSRAELYNDTQESKTCFCK